MNASLTSNMPASCPQRRSSGPAAPRAVQALNKSGSNETEPSASAGV